MGRPRSSYFLWILGHVLRALFVLLVIAICGFLLWRMIFSKQTPSELREISRNEVLVQAYEANGGKLTVLSQPSQVPYTEGGENYADYHVDDCLFFDEANQAQLVFFYNNSVLRDLSAEWALPEELPKGEEVLGVELFVRIDVTPEGAQERVFEDVVIRPDEVLVAKSSLYTFFRYTFDGVDITSDVAVIYLDVYYEGEERVELGTLRLYHEESKTETRELSAKEEKIIKG